ncbi:MAG: ATP-binding protein [Chloroflexota bacterium]
MIARRRWQQIWLAIIGGGLSFLILLGIALITIPTSELRDLIRFLLYSSIPSLLVGYLIFITGQLRLRYILLKVMLAYALGILIVLVNIYVTARLMFLSEHDFILLGLLLIFAGLLSVSFGVNLATGITQSLRSLEQGTQSLAEGNLSTRVMVPYQDEFSDVADAFNQMAKRLEDSSQRQKELEQARRDLIAAVSHDLRTPLASVRAMVEALSDKVVTDEKTIDRYHDTMQTQITNLSLLIDDFFELSKLDSGRLQLKLEEAQISDLVSDTLESMRAQAMKKSIDLKGSVAPNLPIVLIEVSQIQRVLFNLVQNAIRHTPDDGTISISVSDAEGEVYVEVNDTGEGIARDDLPRIFDEFYRGEKSRNRDTGGAGLGLAISKGIIEAHGGRIWAHSERNVGTTFYFALPAAPTTV